MKGESLNNTEEKTFDQLWAFEQGDSLRATTLFLIFDAFANIGGFIWFAQFLFSFFAKGVNRRLYTRQVMSDTYLLKKN